MKYILDSSGYVESASCNPISCDDKVSQEYKGSIPSGYSSLDEWILNANIRAYKISSGNLVYDSARDAALQAEWAKTGNYNEYSTDEKIIGTWIDGKPIYRTVLQINSISTSNSDLANIQYLHIDNLISMNAILYTDIGGKFPVPLHDSASNYSVLFISDAGRIRGRAAIGSGTFEKMLVTLEYTKN